LTPITAEKLLERGYCCGLKCKNCPYFPQHVTGNETVTNDKMTNKKDKCVICNKITEYTERDPVHIREGYIEGAGQLCKSCLNDVSKEKWLLQDWMSYKMNESEQENAK